MPLDMLPSQYRIQLCTESPRKEVLASLDEVAAMMAAAVGDGVLTRAATADSDDPPPTRDAYEVPASLPSHDEIVQGVMERLAPLLPPPVPDLTAQLREAQDRIAALERRLQEASDDAGDDHDVAGFARRFAAKAPPLAPVAVDTTTAREIAALSVRLTAFEKMMQPEVTTGTIDIKGDAITTLRIAGADRRRKAAPGNGRDMALALKLSEVAHLARSAQSGPMDLMAILGEARNGLSWDQIANEIAHHSDAWARVCVRSYAVELATERLIETADDKDIPALVDSAVDIISKIEG